MHKRTMRVISAVINGIWSKIANMGHKMRENINTNVSGNTKYLNKFGRSILYIMFNNNFAANSST